MPGASNDLNVLASSPLAHALDDGVFPPQGIRYTICGKEFYNPYLLCDGIYPNKPIYMKTFLSPVTDAEKKFTTLQESVRKDIERAFGVLKARFDILRRPFRYWKLEKVRNVVYCCVVLHNMIIRMLPEDEDELRSSYLASDDNIVEEDNRDEEVALDNEEAMAIRRSVIQFQVAEGFHKK